MIGTYKEASAINFAFKVLSCLTRNVKVFWKICQWKRIQRRLHKWSVDKVYKISQINFPFLEGLTNVLGAKKTFKEFLPVIKANKIWKINEGVQRSMMLTDVWSKQIGSNHNSSLLKLMLKSLTQRIKRGKVHRNIMAATDWIMWGHGWNYPNFLNWASKVRFTSLEILWEFLWISFDW